MEKTDIKSLTLPELKDLLREMGEKPFRAGQLYQWRHEKLAASFDEMTNTETLSASLPRSAAGWAAVSAPPPWTDWNGT